MLLGYSLKVNILLYTEQLDVALVERRFEHIKET